MRATWQAVVRELSATALGVRRAWDGPSRERDLIAQAAKAALAAWIAWAVAGWWLHVPAAFVAPWVAVVLVEWTVYRSLAHGLQQLAALAFGTVAATAAGLLISDTVAAMAVVLPPVMLIGHWRRLGSQGIYAATGALFALTAGPVSIGAGAARIGAACFGALVGIGVNALIRPPVYLRDARALLQDATDEAYDILREVAGGLAEGRLEGAEEAGAWHERALRLYGLVEQARAAMAHSRESLRANFRHRTGSVPPPGQAYDDALTVLDYAAVHTAGVTRTVLEVASADGSAPRLEHQLAGQYAKFLNQTARALHLYGHSRFGRGGDEALREAVETMRDTLAPLRRGLIRSAADDPDRIATYGALLTQAHRLADQLQASVPVSGMRT
ncbi:aromatic acid exporter family protein [Streptomyces sp. NPDC005435]|uniref:FUSC family protein n=1 Tax=Streptomyces sp. NPDC005435 TaxID=3154464 RepID=UPI00345731A7